MNDTINSEKSMSVSTDRPTDGMTRQGNGGPSSTPPLSKEGEIMNYIEYIDRVKKVSAKSTYGVTIE